MKVKAISILGALQADCWKNTEKKWLWCQKDAEEVKARQDEDKKKKRDIIIAN